MGFWFAQSLDSVLFLADVMMSARTLIHLFRSLNPDMLQKKFRVSVCVVHSLKTDVLKNDNWSQYLLENGVKYVLFFCLLPLDMVCCPHFASSHPSNSC